MRFSMFGLLGVFGLAFVVQAQAAPADGAAVRQRVRFEVGAPRR